MDNSKPCTRCKQVVSLDLFYKEKSSKDGRRTICKNCDSITKSNYYQNNKEIIITKSINWGKANKEKKRKYNTDSYHKNKNKNKVKRSESFRRWRLANPAKDKVRALKRRSTRKNAVTFEVKAMELKKLLQKPCFYCGNKSTQIDHVIPLSRGGNHSIGNLIGACAHCNQSKKDKFIMEWRKK